jgi:DNA-binding NarL/FixJ family response regulator
MNSVIKLQVLVAHNEPLLAAGLEATLLREDDFDVSAIAPSSLERTSVDAHEFMDVILADCITGIRLASSMRARKEAPARARIVIVTQDESELSIRRAMEAGVRGYLLLGATRDSVVEAVRCAARGGIALDPVAATRMADSLNGDSLTSREREVLSLVMVGLSNKVIAHRLGITVGTAKTHVKGVLMKLDAKTRTEAAAIAQRRGLIVPPVSSKPVTAIERPHPRAPNVVDRYSRRLRLRDKVLPNQSTSA